MKMTRHRYTVMPEYVAQNRQNLDEFIAVPTRLRCLAFPIEYSLKRTGKPFLHLVTPQDDLPAVITGLPSFKKFQPEMLASDPIARPDQAGMSLMATSGDS